MRHSDSKCWDSIEAPLRRLLARFVGELKQKDSTWRELFKANNVEIGKAKDLSEVEVQSLLAVLLRNTEQRPDRGTRLFGVEGPGERLRDQLAYLTTLRNKYRHDPYVPATEQVADILLVGRLAEQLAQCSDTFADERANLRSALALQLGIFWSAVQESGMAEISVAEAEPPTHHVGLEDVERIHSEVQSLREAIVAGIDGPKPDKDAELRALLIETQQVIIARATTAEDKLHRIDVRLESLSADLRQSTAALVAHDASSRAGQPDETHQGDANARLHATDIDGILADIFAESQRQSPRPRAQTVHYTPEQVRDQLIQLRRRIWRETGTRASADGLLRKGMIDHLIRHRVQTEKEFYSRIPTAELSATNPAQLVFLPDVLEIMQGLDASNSGK